MQHEPAKKMYFDYIELIISFLQPDDASIYYPSSSRNFNAMNQSIPNHESAITLVKTNRSKQKLLFSGAIAGAISTILFTIIHHILISDIWFSIGIMLIAGVLCGVCMAWSYKQCFGSLTILNWLKYNTLYTILIMLLGLVSVIVFEPITTVAAAIAANKPPTELIMKALPMTAVYTLFMAITVHQIYDGNRKYFGVILINCIILVALLGLNVSSIGLVSFAGSSLFLIVKLFLLILVLDVFFVTTFILLERKTFLHKE